MTKYYAVGTLVAWNALTVDEQAFYDGNHYLTLDNAVGALPATPTDNYETQHISDTTEGATSTLPSSFNGKILTINFCGFTYTSTSSANDIYSGTTTTTYHLILKNLKFIDNVAKPFSYRANINLGNNNIITAEIKDCGFTGNTQSGTSIYALQCASLEITNILSQNKEYGIYAGNDGNTVIEGCVTYNCIRGINGGTGTVVRNTYSDGSAVGIASGSVDGGGNATSDNSAFNSELRSITPEEAFKDPDNGDFTPKSIMKQGVAPTIDGHAHDMNGIRLTPPYYIGPISKKRRRINKNRRRKIRMIMED